MIHSFFCKSLSLILVIQLICPLNVFAAGDDPLENRLTYSYENGSCQRTQSTDLTQKEASRFTRWLQKIRNHLPSSQEKQCISSGQSFNSSSLDSRLPEAVIKADQILKEYQSFSPSDLRKQMELVRNSPEFKKLMELQEDSANKEKEKALLEKIGKKAIKFIATEGPFGVLAEKATDCLAHSGEKAKAAFCSNSNQEKEKRIPLKELIPGDSKKIAAIKIGEGVLLVTFGVTGTVAGVFSFGLGTLPFSLTNIGIEMVVDPVTHKMGHFNRQKIIDTASSSILEKPSNSREVLTTRTIESGAEKASYAPIKSTIEYAENAALYKTAAVIPFAGLSWQIIHGLSNIKKGITGYEKDHEILKKYELIYQNILKENINQTKKNIAEIQRELNSLSIGEDESVSSFDIDMKQSALCTAEAWLNEFQEKSDEKFKKRHKYLDEKLALEKKRDHLKNEALSVIGLDETKRDQKKILKLNQNLSDLEKQLDKEYMNAIQEFHQVFPDASSQQGCPIHSHDQRFTDPRCWGYWSRTSVNEIEKIEAQGIEGLKQAHDIIQKKQDRNFALVAQIKENLEKQLQSSTRLTPIEVQYENVDSSNLSQIEAGAQPSSLKITHSEKLLFRTTSKALKKAEKTSQEKRRTELEELRIKNASR